MWDKKRLKKTKIHQRDAEASGADDDDGEKPFTVSSHC